MKDRTVLWVFLAFIVGFAMPVCSCAGTGLLAIGALGRMTTEPATATLGSGDAVAVIRLDGAIASGASDLRPAGVTPDRVSDLLDQAAASPAIKAVVVRVNSPGGSVVASDEIYHALLDFDKPVVIWMDEMAASGGYYISCGGDYIFAHPDTLTGSIGVISQFVNAQELLDKVGVDVVVITSGPHKDMGSLFRGMTDDEQEMWRGVTDEIYGEFVQVVAQARDLPVDDVREMADGRVYTGKQALELGLVDELGVVDDAIAKAAELGGIEGEPQVIELKPTPSLMEMFYGLQARSTVPTVDEILSWAGAPAVQFQSAGGSH